MDETAIGLRSLAWQDPSFSGDLPFPRCTCLIMQPRIRKPTYVFTVFKENRQGGKHVGAKLSKLFRTPSIQSSRTTFCLRDRLSNLFRGQSRPRLLWLNLWCVFNEFIPKIIRVGNVSLPNLRPKLLQVFKILLNANTSRRLRAGSDGWSNRMSIPTQPSIRMFVLFHFFCPSTESVVISLVSDLF